MRHDQETDVTSTRLMRQARGHGYGKPQDGTVRTDILKAFDDVARDCGGNPEKLLLSVGLSPDVVKQSGYKARIPQSKIAALLNNAASWLQRPDFGLKLASRQSPNGIGGPLSIAMRNCATLGEAFRFCADHIYTYSDGSVLTLKKDPDGRRWILRLEMLLSAKLDQRQIVEHSLLRTYLIAQFLSGNRVKAREIWFRHDPIGPLSVYRSYFDANLHFSRLTNAVVFDANDESAPVIGYDKEVYELATSFIDSQWMKPDEPLQQKVRQFMLHHGATANASTSEVAASLGMHARTFQRRLKQEGVRFDAIKDEVCRELALKYLRETRLPLIRIANMLGYSELSSFTRRCQHWFSCSPRELRRGNSEPGRNAADGIGMNACKPESFAQDWIGHLSRANR